MKNCIKKMREEKRMTQEELAARAGVTRVTIISLENDEAYVTTTRTLVKVADALGTSVDQIFLH